MWSWVQLLVYICTVLIFCVNGEITPIQNSTGEYFIANSTSNSLQNETIICNTSLSTSNCFVICEDPVPDVCLNTNIQCATTNCTINCGKESCHNININTSRSSSTNILCDDANSCPFMRFTMINEQMSSINMVCNGNASCTNSIIRTDEVDMSIDCKGSTSCSSQTIYTGTNDILQYQCYKNSGHHSRNCAGSKLTVSGLSNHTQLICNGGNKTESCNEIKVYVPQSYQPEFIDIEYVNNNGSIIAAMDDSANSMEMYCISLNNTIPCNTYTKFPIIGIAKSSGNNNSYVGSAAYSYRFREIQCNDAINKCDIKCLGTGSCDFTQILQNGSSSIGHLFCNECHNVAIEANGKSLDINCADNACDTISVVTPSTAAVTINCNTTSQKSCSSFVINTANSISLTCSGDKSCQFMTLNAGNHTDLNCMDTTSCLTVTIDTNNGASIQCAAPNACDTLEVRSNGGEFNALCQYDSSCAGSTFNLTHNNVSNTNLDCSGVTSCSPMVLNTYSENININCSGCEAAHITAYSPDSKLSLHCKGSSSCSTMNVNMDGSIQLNCDGDESCANSGFYTLTKQTQNIPDTSTIKCDGKDACNTLTFIAATDITIDCTGSQVCAASTIQSVTGRVDAHCGNTNDSESCIHSTITSVNGVSMVCSGDNGCAHTNITSNGALNLDCSGSGNSICAHMNIDSTHNQSNNTFICGNNLNSSQSACSGFMVNTFAKNIDFQCLNTGCNHSDIFVNNINSKLSMNCRGSNACLASSAITNGEVDIHCTGSSSCEGAYIASSEVSLSCEGSDACSKTNIGGSGNLLLNCTAGGTSNCGQMVINMTKNNNQTRTTNTFLCGRNSKIINESVPNHSCSGITVDTFANNIHFDCYNKGCLNNNIVANNPDSKLTMNCNGNSSCSHSGLTSNGAISINCNGDGSCKDHSIFRTIKQNVTTTLNCTGLEACSSLRVETPANLSMNCIGEKSCFSATRVSNAVSLICYGKNACLQSNITGNGDLFLDCSGGGSNTCEQMVIDMASNPSYTSNELLCGDVNNLNKNNSCSRMVLKTYADEIKFACGSNYGCYGAHINLLKPPSSLLMSCLATGSCNTVNTLTNGLIVFHCKGDKSCEAVKINPTLSEPRNPGKSTINCVNSKACQSLQVKTPTDITVTCEEKEACSSSTIESFGSVTMECTANNTCSQSNITGGAGGISLKCQSSNSCKAATVKLAKEDVSAPLIANCLGGDEYAGSCDNVQFSASNASLFNITCADKFGCNGIKVSAMYVDQLNLIARSDNSDANSFVNSSIDAIYAKNVSVNCKGLCSGNTINANYSNNVYIGCDTLSFDGTEGFMGGCAKWNIYASNADMVGLEFLGKYSGLNGVVDVSNAKMVNITYQSDIGYTDNDKNERSLIEGPLSDKGVMTLQCYNYGCNFGKFQTKDGLIDMNITFEGECKCDTIEDCVDEWDLKCAAGNNSFNGDKCSDGDKCCDQHSVEHIQDSFNKYAKLICPSGGGSSSNKLSGGAIAGITIGVICGIILIAGAIYYFKIKKKSLLEEKLVNPTENT